MEFACNCPRNCTTFTFDLLLQLRSEYRQFGYYENGRNMLDSILLSLISTLARSDDTVRHARKNTDKVRERLGFTFFVHEREVCETFFLFTHAISRKRWQNLVAHYKRSHCSVQERIHGNYGKSPLNMQEKFEHRQFIVNFIRNYAEDCALYLPGRVANQRSIVKLLPSCETKIDIYKKYKNVAQEEK